MALCPRDAGSAILSIDQDRQFAVLLFLTLRFKVTDLLLVKQCLLQAWWLD